MLMRFSMLMRDSGISTETQLQTIDGDDDAVDSEQRGNLNNDDETKSES